MKGALPTLTRAEAEIMQLLWARGRATVHELVEGLPRPVAYTTVLTLVRILEKKGYARHEPDPAGGRAYVYLPAVAHEKAQRHHARDLLQRLFSGRAEELIAGLVDEERLSQEELARLRDKIDAKLGAAPKPAAPKPKKGRGQDG